MLTQKDLENIQNILSVQLEPVLARLDGLENRMDKLEKRMDKLEERMDKLEGRMDKLDERMDKLEKRMFGMEEWKQVFSVDCENTFVRIFKEFKHLDQRITTIVDFVAGHTDMLRDISVNMISLGGRLDRTDANIDDVYGHIYALKKELGIKKGSLMVRDVPRVKQQ